MTGRCIAGFNNLNFYRVDIVTSVAQLSHTSQDSRRGGDGRKMAQKENGFSDIFSAECEIAKAKM